MPTRQQLCFLAGLLTLGATLPRVAGAAQTASPAQTSEPQTAPASPDAAGNYPIGGEVRPPVLLTAANPEYTQDARDKHIEGDITVALVVDVSGTPTDVRVLHGLGSGLDQRAVEAVRQYRFKPATKAGVPVPTRLFVKVNFKII